MIGARPLLVVDHDLLWRQNGLCEHLEEHLSHAPVYFYDDRAMDEQNRPLPRLVLAIDWELYLNPETALFPIKLSAHAQGSLNMATVPFSNPGLESVTLTVGASLGVYIAGILRRRCHPGAFSRWLSHKTPQDQYSAADHSEPFNKIELQARLQMLVNIASAKLEVRRTMEDEDAGIGYERIVFA